MAVSMRPREARSSVSLRDNSTRTSASSDSSCSNRRDSIVGSGLRGVQFGAAVDMFPVQPVYFRLAALAAIFVLTDPFPGLFQAEFQVALARSRAH